MVGKQNKNKHKCEATAQHTQVHAVFPVYMYIYAKWVIHSLYGQSSCVLTYVYMFVLTMYLILTVVH